ncbi:MAG: hypothetical protein Q7I97_06085 [Thermovirgaceae bacterium]|nr:hypothetical protein [Thermovirgaceae bacterium]
MITFEEYREAFAEWEISDFSEPFKFRVKVYPDRATYFMRTEFAKNGYVKRVNMIATLATICLLGSIPAFIWLNWMAGLSCFFGFFFLNKITSSCAEKFVSKQILEDGVSFYHALCTGIVEISPTD